MSINFRKLIDCESDYKKLHTWCSKDFVYEWFEQRILSYGEIVNKYKNKLINSKQELLIIKCDDKDIGLVQIYKYEDTLDINKLNNYKNIYEYDLYIGIEEYLNRGIGSIVINKINDIIVNKYNADLIILRPFSRNIRAIKCYMKCGFKEIYEYKGKDTLGNDELKTVLIKEV